MAKKSNTNDTKTVTRYSKSGTKVTVSEDLAKKLGTRFTTTPPATGDESADDGKTGSKS